MAYRTEPGVVVTTVAPASLTAFSWRPLVEIAPQMPATALLRGSDAAGLFEEYEGRVARDFDCAKALRVLRYSPDARTICGSNPFAVALINHIVRDAALRSAAPSELERALTLDALPLKGHYHDSALVLRSEGDANDYLARSLAMQCRGRNRKLQLPVLLPLAGLDLIVDRASPHGLAFNLRKDSVPIPAPILVHEGYFSDTDVDAATGLPRTLGKGDRYLDYRRGGLTRFSFAGANCLYTRDDCLVTSRDYGRIVLVRGSTVQGLI